MICSSRNGALEKNQGHWCHLCGYVFVMCRLLWARKWDSDFKFKHFQDSHTGLTRDMDAPTIDTGYEKDVSSGLA